MLNIDFILKVQNLCYNHLVACFFNLILIYCMILFPVLIFILFDFQGRLHLPMNCSIHFTFHLNSVNLNLLDLFNYSFHFALLYQFL